MSEIILYPTETVYGLGVNAFDSEAWSNLCILKGRDTKQQPSWLVRSISDINRLGEVNEVAKRIIEEYLPGPLTIILKATAVVPKNCQALDGTVSFRISSDIHAQELINEYMGSNDGVPLTCTNANRHGLLTLKTPFDILNQLGQYSHMVTKVIDCGAREGYPSTVVRIVGDGVEVVREGVISLESFTK